MEEVADLLSIHLITLKGNFFKAELFCGKLYNLTTMHHRLLPLTNSSCLICRGTHACVNLSASSHVIYASVYTVPSGFVNHRSPPLSLTVEAGIAGLLRMSLCLLCILKKLELHCTASAKNMKKKTWGAKNASHSLLKRQGGRRENPRFYLRN
ncbi:hypothetical protein TNIN_144351 [Trichonephila inaurata madagascariensis]|uniref:Uncharacterized protein n=1 Tax=Trichonephila inaurata madagascariensis TaxID=2747483 RepID=A0A8X6IDE1_9ARAC|nr:hypothetical protein TNIN_144351 [Trichonephila inaurata madagascariensis]